MSFRQATKRNRVTGAFKSSLAAFLLALYLIGNIQAEVIHELLHSRDAIVAHSSEHEKDPCHRKLYHDDKRSGCAHKAHLTKIEKCDLCHLIVGTGYLAFVGPYPVLNNYASVIGAQTTRVQVSDVSTHLPSRAPPAV